MSDESFKDFVPEGENTGAITDDGFRDWVPDPEAPVESKFEHSAVENEQLDARPELAQPEAEPVVEPVQEPTVAPLEQPKKTRFEQIKDAVTGAISYKEVTE